MRHTNLIANSAAEDSISAADKCSLARRHGDQLTAGSDDSQQNGGEDWREDTPHSYRVPKLIATDIVHSPFPGSPSIEIVPSPFPSSPNTDIVHSPFPGSPSNEIVPSPFPGSPSTEIVPSSFPSSPTTDIVPSPFTGSPSTEIASSPFPGSPGTEIAPSPFPGSPSTEIVPSSFPGSPTTDIVHSPSPASPSAEIVLAQIDSTNTHTMCLIKGSPPNSKNSPYTAVKRFRPAVSRSLPSRGTAASLWPHCPSTPGGQPSGRGIAPRRTVLGASEALSHQRADWVTPVAICVIGIILVGHVLIALYSTSIRLLAGLMGPTKNMSTLDLKKLSVTVLDETRNRCRASTRISFRWACSMGQDSNGIKIANSNRGVKRSVDLYPKLNTKLKTYTRLMTSGHLVGITSGYGFPVLNIRPNQAAYAHKTEAYSDNVDNLVANFEQYTAQG
uniref:Uncharacterized protein n=1 Tax=Timema poppense TaxID=170557 RepID=A0A7R9CQT9_TIMPO|nr:unnamed protein product [Timema poppensis]